MNRPALSSENQLTSHGHKVFVATNGEEAATLLRVGLRPDVIITDNVMPGQVQGLDLVRIARELSPDISSLIISGYPDDVHSRLGGSEREIKVLSKPFRKSELLEAIRLVAQKQD